MISQPADRRRWRPATLGSRCWEQAQQIDRWWPRSLREQKEQLLLLQLKRKLKARAKLCCYFRDATSIKENYTHQVSCERKQSSRVTNKMKTKTKESERMWMWMETRMSNSCQQRRQEKSLQLECDFKSESKRESERECECKCCCNDRESVCEKGKTHENVKKERDSRQQVVGPTISRTARAMILGDSKESSTTTPSSRSASESSLSVAVRAVSRSMYYTSIVFSLLLLFSWSPDAICSASDTTSASNTSSYTNNRWTAERSNQTLGLPFDDLVAFGGTSVLAPPVGRLLDSIASPTSTNNRTKKLDYIVEFMRAHKLNVFCDLLTGDSPDASAVRDQLNELPQFTLFVPTNEALLLMPSTLLAELRSNPREARKFLLSHAVSELIAPKAPGISQTDSLAGGTLWTVAANQSGKLELAVNGAGVVSGGSYALQEQQNASATYAIVHLLERSLYPIPELNLLELIRTRAPKMTNFIMQDRELSEMLADLSETGRLWTVFAPSDDAFSALKLSSSSSDLPLRHQIFSANQTFLATFLRNHLIKGIHLSTELSQTNKMHSLTNSDLLFETKRLQSRQLLLVNSIPILESDLLAKNGVLHLLSRPLIEGGNLSDCRCPGGSSEAIDHPSRLSPTPKNQLDDSDALNSLAGNELERDESAQSVTSKQELSKPVERIPRSGNLVARNNRDFYRPSAAPANLLLIPGTNQQNLPTDPFELERYKVLNATNRQRMRELLRLPVAGEISSAQQASSGSSSENQFVYDKPFTSQRSETAARGSPSDNMTTWYDSSAKLRAYASAPTLSTQTDQLTSSTDRQQRQLLKFQPEDARLPDPATQAAVKQQQLLGKTAQPPGFTGCAFYDANCKRLLSKLVRLPSPLKLPPSASDQQHLDVTFGETSEPTLAPELNRSLSNSSESQLLRPVASLGALPSRLQAAAARVSPLNQPLPPWGDEEKLVASWPRVQPDLTRLTSNPASPLEFAPGLSRQVAQQVFANKSPIHNSSLALQVTGVAAKNPHQPNLGNEKAIFVSPNPVKLHSAPLLRNFTPFRPTPYSISPVTTHLPPMFQQPARLTNFSSYDQFNSDSYNYNGSALSDQFQPVQHPRTPKRVVLKTQIVDSTGQQLVVPLGPVAFRKQRLQQLGNAADQSQQSKLSGINLQQGTGDISITSARLTASQQSMATQESNQAPINQITSSGAISRDQVIRSLPNQGAGSTELSTDFFQDRSIAEIMDDSGLRIDDNQVTFTRLKECLVEANLLSLLSQTGNSVTIFLPTDSAFQRLVQQQQLLQQQRGSLASRSARLTDSGRLIPLVARRQGSSRSLAQLDSLSNLPIDQRLTLDCGSPQMRAILLDHLSARLITPKQLQQDTAITSLAGHQLLLSSVPSKKIVVVDGQPVIAATRAQNGMVYVVNKFLNLTQQMPNLVQLIQAQPNLTTFLSYLTFYGLTDRLQRETGPLTVLAPSNEAFDQLSPSSRQLINSDPAALMDVLRGHIIEGAQYGKLISMRNQLKTLNSDQTIEAAVIKPNFYLLDNQMTAMRFIGTTGNGVLNIIDRIIVPSWLRVPNSSTRNFRESEEIGVRSTTGTASSPTLVNHLPVISGQPVRFEQQGARFNPSSDSFLLESSGEPSTQTSSPFPRTSSSTNLTGANSSSSGHVNSKQLRYTRNIQLIEKLSDLMQVNKFVKFLLSSRVAESLKPDMNYVILVPTDQAIEKLPKQIIEMLERDPERLADLVNYHVLDTTFEYINTIPDGSTLNTLNEKDILFNWHRNNTILTASGAVVMGGIQEDNIALLIVDRVLYPTPGDILQIVSKSPILSNFTSLLRNAGLEQQLSLPGPYTLFAPSDFAFNQLEAREFEFLQRNKDTARRFLLRHLSQPTVFTSSIALSNLTLPSRGTSAASQQPLPTMTISNSLGEELTLRQRNDYFSVNDVNFSYADVAATNGVVHVIDGLL